jgi:hypothetical protein
MHEINHVLGENTVSHSAVGKCVRAFVLATKETNTPIVPGSEDDFTLDDHITLVLSEESFFSVRQIVKKAMTSKLTVRRHLTQTKRWKLRHLK